MKKPITDDRLRNVRAWAAARPDMSGSDVIVAAIDELLERRVVEPTREHPTTDPATAYRTSCNHPADARGLTGCLLCGAPF
jgi:hypothetical protein